MSRKTNRSHNDLKPDNVLQLGCYKDLLVWTTNEELPLGTLDCQLEEIDKELTKREQASRCVPIDPEFSQENGDTAQTGGLGDRRFYPGCVLYVV